MRSAISLALITSLLGSTVRMQAQAQMPFAPGEEVSVTLRSSNGETLKRYFLHADPTHVTLLNLTDPALPSRVQRVLRETASKRPDVFLALEGDRKFLLGQGIRLERAGVFVDDREVADISEIVDVFDQGDVTVNVGPYGLPKHTYGRLLISIAVAGALMILLVPGFFVPKT